MPHLDPDSALELAMGGGGRGPCGGPKREENGGGGLRGLLLL